MYTTTDNSNVCISNQFVQHIQKVPLSAAEYTIIHAALLCVHKKTKTFTRYILNTQELGLTTPQTHAAIKLLQKREWFGHKLFNKLEYLNRQYALVVEFNPLLSQHLLEVDGNYTCLPISTIPIQNNHAWRMLWVLCSYRTKFRNSKYFSLEDVNLLFFGVPDKYTTFSRTNLFVQRVLSLLKKSGVLVGCEVVKRGVVNVGYIFTFPACKPIVRVRVGRTTVSTPTPAPVAAAITAPTPEPTTVVLDTVVNPLKALLQAAIGANTRTQTTRTLHDPGYEAEPDYSREIIQQVDYKPALQTKLRVQRDWLVDNGVYRQEANNLVKHVFVNQHKETQFFQELYNIKCRLKDRNQVALSNPAGFIVKNLKNVLNLQ